MEPSIHISTNVLVRTEHGLEYRIEGRCTQCRQVGAEGQRFNRSFAMSLMYWLRKVQWQGWVLDWMQHSSRAWFSLQKLNAKRINQDGSRDPHNRRWNWFARDWLNYMTISLRKREAQGQIRRTSTLKKFTCASVYGTFPMYTGNTWNDLTCNFHEQPTMPHPCDITSCRSKRFDISTGTH